MTPGAAPPGFGAPVSSKRSPLVPILALVVIVAVAAAAFFLMPKEVELPATIGTEPRIQGGIADTLQQGMDRSLDGTGAEGFVGVYGGESIAPTYMIALIDPPSGAGPPDLSDPTLISGPLGESGASIDPATKTSGSEGGPTVDCYGTETTAGAPAPAFFPIVCAWAIDDNLVILAEIDGGASGPEAVLPTAIATANEMAA